MGNYFCLSAFVYIRTDRIVKIMNHLPSHLVKQWNTQKNTLSATEISAGSGKKVWWVCELGHEWEAAPSTRLRGSGCPVCSNRVILPGFNDLATLNPIVALQWHPTKNKGLLPSQVSVRSGKKAWWACESCRYSWEASIANRKNHGCPACAGNSLIVGQNDLASQKPDLASELHPTKNGTVTAQNVTVKSHRKLWWICELGHEWEASPSNRSNGTGCPVCSGNIVALGENDLTTTHPEISAQWHPTLNTRLANEFSLGSTHKAWWLGECGHEWEAFIYHRTAGESCPMCLNRIFLPHFNDLGTLHPELAKEWDEEANGMPASQVPGYRTILKVHWKCSENENHTWATSVAKRIEGTGCPFCRKSEPEKQLAEYIQQFHLSVKQNDRKTLSNKFEIDILVPEKNIGIEFNGVYWHSEAAGKTRNYHHDKWVAAKEVGMQLIQIWEDDWNRNSELVKRMLAHKLGVSQERTVYARKTLVVELSKNETETFLNQNHIQGHSNGSHYLGLRDGESNKIVAVLVLKKEPGTDGRILNIVRYATSCNVVGGFTKLLKYAERTYQPKSFITFADHCVSDGGLYENNGFVADRELDPDYMYVVKGERKHKFGYRIKRFRNDPALKFEEGLTERSLAALNNLSRIWDAGKTRYTKQVKEMV